MKRTVIFILAILFVTFSINSLSAQGVVAKGIRLGLNMANVSGDDAEDTSMKMGFAAGAFLTYQVNEQLFLQPEILYTMKGFKMEESDDDYNYDATVSLNYLEIPVLGVFNVNEQLRLLAGPYLAIYLNGESEYEESYDDGYYSYEDSGTEDIESEDINSPEFGLTFGGEMLFNQLSIGVRYSLGLSNIPDEDEVEFKNSVIQIMAGFTFQ